MIKLLLPVSPQVLAIETSPLAPVACKVALLSNDMVPELTASVPAAAVRVIPPGAAREPEPDRVSPEPAGLLMASVLATPLPVMEPALLRAGVCTVILPEVVSELVLSRLIPRISEADRDRLPVTVRLAPVNERVPLLAPNETDGPDKLPLPETDRLFDPETERVEAADKLPSS